MDIKTKAPKVIAVLSLVLTLTSCVPSYSTYWSSHRKPSHLGGYYYSHYGYPYYYRNPRIYIGVGRGRRYHHRHYRRAHHGPRYYSGSYSRHHMRGVHRRRVGPAGADHAGRGGPRGAGPRGGGSRS